MRRRRRSYPYIIRCKRKLRIELQLNMEESKSERAMLSFWGDVSFGLEVEPIVEKNGFAYCFDGVRDAFKGSSLNVVNFDCTITEATQKNRFRDGSHLKTKPAAALAMKQAGIDGVVLANNHIYDYGTQGIEDTMAAFDAAGIQYAGVGKTAAEALSPMLLEDADGRSVGIISSCALPVESSDNCPYMVGPFDLDLLKQAIDNCVDKVDHLIVSIHWGREFVHHPFRSQIEAARQLIDWGAGAVIGHHPHVVGSVESYGSGYIAYSLGDFVFDQRDHQGIPHRHDALGITLRHADTRVLQGEYVPVRVDSDYRPLIAVGEARSGIVEFVEELSSELCDLKLAEAKANGAASVGFFGHQIRSIRKSFINGGLLSVVKKAARVRPVHVKLFFVWLKKKVSKF